MSKHVVIPLSVSQNTGDPLKYIYIDRADFCANVQVIPSLREETLIEEEIPLDATEEWLDTLTDIETQNFLIINDKNSYSSEMPQMTLNNINEIKNIKADTFHNDWKQFNAGISSATEDIAVTKFSKQQTAVCAFCHKTFINHSKLNWHMRMHNKNRKCVVCPVKTCGRLYASKQSFDQHYRQSHLDEGVFCSTCHKIFSSKQTLEIHMRYHTKEFPYKCNQCEKKFAQKGHLTQHIEIKHQNLRYICTEPNCGKIFQNSVSLKNHNYTHSSMPFKCNYCNKEYPQKNKLKVHLLQKHNVEYSLDNLESMRQFKTVRTRHTYIKVRTVEVDDDSDNDLRLPSEYFLNDSDIGI